MTLFWLLEILLAFLGFIFIAAYVLRNNDLPKNWPIVGMLPYLLLHLSHLHDWATELLIKSRHTFLFKGLWITGLEIYLTGDPENVNYMLNTNFTNFPKGVEFRELFDVFGDALVNLDFEAWKTQRRIGQLIITHTLFKKFVVRSTMTKIQKGLIPVLDSVVKGGVVVDIQQIVQRFMFDANCLAVNGYDPASLSLEFPQIAFVKAMDDAEEVIFYRHVVPKKVWKFLSRMNVGFERKHKVAWKTLDRIMEDAIAMKRREIEDAKNEAKDDEIGASLLESYLRDYDYDDQFVRDTMLGYLLAGRDTVSAVLLWLIWLVSCNKEAEERIREELNSVVSPDENGRRRLFTDDEVKGMTYLHCALSETMRLYPPVPFELKVPAKPDTLPSGHRVLPKHRIIISLYSMGRLPSVWGDDCLEFKPERWISERGGVKHEPSHKFIAFHAGPRSCLGKEVAFSQLKLVTAALFHNYDIEVVKGQDMSPRSSIILLMKNGLKVKITDRWS